MEAAALQMRGTMSVWLRTALGWWSVGRLEFRLQVSGCSYFFFFSPGHGGIKGAVPSYVASGELSQHGSAERSIAAICSGGIISFTHLTDWNAI